MMQTESLKNKFVLKELELNSLLEITQAINSNLPEASLYKIYDFTLRANLNIKKLALYVLDEFWSCKVFFGTENDFSQIDLEEEFQQYDAISTIGPELKSGFFGEFEYAIPILHKTKLLAVVFVSGVENNPNDDDVVDTTFVQALSNIIIVAIENKKLARKELRQEAMKKELEIARHVQQFLFPKSLPKREDLSVAASYLPHYSVGGDYYDFIEINEDKFLICIADVSGKGMPAAILMSNFQAALRTLVRQTQDLMAIVKELNYQILQSANGENFITFFGAIYDKKSKIINYINAGHNPPILIDQNSVLHTLDSGTTVLGAFHPLPFLNEGTMTDLSEIFFFAFTDGLTETFNENDEEFGAEKLKLFIEMNSEKELQKIHQELLLQLNDFKGKNDYNDDITLLSCRVKDQSAAR